MCCSTKEEKGADSEEEVEKEAVIPTFEETAARFEAVQRHICSFKRNNGR
jgi:hypothetical protein